MTAFGNRLKKLRKEKELRQKDLATALGLAQTTIANYEQGIRFPSQDILYKFADYFHVSIDYLLGREHLNIYNNNFSEENVLNLGEFDDTESLYETFFNLLIKGQQYKANQFILSAINKGVDIKNIYTDVFEQALKKVGYLWEQGQMDIFQEHYISSAIETMMSNLSLYRWNHPKQKYSIIGLCTHGEFHSIGLKMVLDFFEMEGWNTFYLGTNIPTESVIKSVIEYKADVLAISATMSYHINSVKNIIETLRKSKDCTKTKILVGGNAFNIDKALWKNVGADFYAHNAGMAVKLVLKSFEQ